MILTSRGALLDYEGGAHYLCTTPRHLRELWAKRHVAAVKVGQHVRFTQADLDAFIATNRANIPRSVVSIGASR